MSTKIYKGSRTLHRFFAMPAILSSFFDTKKDVATMSWTDCIRTSVTGTGEQKHAGEKAPALFILLYSIIKVQAAFIRMLRTAEAYAVRTASGNNYTCSYSEKRTFKTQVWITETHE